MKKFLNIIVFIFMIFLSITPVLASSNANVTVSGEYNYSYAAEVLKLVNEERQERGLSTLKMDSKLTALAMERAKELSIYYSHTRPNGEAWYSIMKLSKGETYGENAAVGQITPASAMSDWMDSEGHKINIVNKNYKSMGVGCYKNGIYTYWVQIFSTEATSNEKIETGKRIEKEGSVSVSSKNIDFMVAWNKNVNPITLKVGESIEPIQVQLKNGGWTYVNTIISKKDLTWKSSDTSVFTVDKNGKVTATGNGLANLIVTLGGVKKQYQVKVGYSPITGVSIDSKTASLEVGKTTTLKATITPSITTESKKLVWESSDEKVATVDSNGKVTAKKKGTTTITVITSNGKIATMTVTVKEPAKTATLSTSELVLEKEKTATIKVASASSKNEKLTWKSSNEKIVTVDSKGKITAKKPGTAIITVNSSSGKKASVKVTVTKIKADSITYPKISDKTYTGKKITPSITLKNGKTILKQGKDYTVQYGSNKSTGKATITIEFKGDYTGTKTITFYIVPKKVLIRTPKSTSRQSLTAYYSKTTGASGYQIAYRLKGAKEWKYVTSTGSSRKITGLSSKKTYEIKVRAYKLVSSKKKYGAWSSIKRIKVK